MAGDMESILFKGDDSSSGESDSEPQTTTQPNSTGNRPGPPSGASVTRTDSSSGSMSQSEMAQRLKSMYSPASKSANGSAVQVAAPPQVVSTQPVTLSVPVIAQQLPQHRTQQQIQQVQKVSGTVNNYRPASAGESAQQQQRIGLQQQLQRSSSQQQQVQQRPGVGIAHQIQSAVPNTSSIPHATEHQQSRSKMHQMQAPSIPHRPSNRLPHQQQSVHHASHGQPPGASLRIPPPSVPSQSMQQNTAPRPSNYGTSGSQHQQQAQQASTMDRALMEKKQKERFLVFTRVLMKYLEQKDPPLYSKVKSIIKDCAERNKRKEAGFESVTASMRIQLRKVVNDVYWKKAEDYLKHFLKEKAAKSGMPSSGGAYNSNATSAATTNTIGSSQEIVKQSNEIQMQPQHRQPETQRESNLDPGKGNVPPKRDDQIQQRHVPSVLASTKSPTQTKSVISFPAGKERAVPKSRAKGSTTPTQQRRQSFQTGPINSEAAMTVPVALVSAPSHVQVVREYNELMENVDHAFGFDWRVTGSILGDSFYATMSEEQKRLLYDSKYVASEAAQNLGSEGVCFPVEGWSNRNIISSRVAWSRLRGGRKQISSAVSTSTNPLVASGLLGLKPVPGKKPVTIEGSCNSDGIEFNMEWYNEDLAEADVGLAVLSEGAEIYLKAILEKALYCARQRQNLDGIRLWHQQITNDAKPSLYLRLGCDVERQVAQAEGNAALICKRMEVANKRQSDIPIRDRIMNDFTLKNAQSMSDLGLRPQLDKAEAAAELEGKRKFEIYGGKYSEEPPLGRLVKVAKLEVVDFQTGMSLSRRRRRHQAATSSSSFFF